MPLWHIHTCKNECRDTMHTAHGMCFSPLSTHCSLIMDVQFSFTKKFQWEKEDFIKIKSLLVLLLLELLQQSHLCSTDCQVTVCDTGERKECQGKAGGRTNKPIPHLCFHLSLLPVEQIGALHCYWEQREKHRQVTVDKERQMSGRERTRQWQNRKK